jgi:cytochrome c oxidase cbb3-type subunit I
MTVNPKKLRPYDEPPKRRRRLIPDGPDSAATGFFVVAGLWLVVATGIGALALGARIIPVELEYPIPLPFLRLGFELNQERLDYAFVNASVYGWLSNAGFAAIAFFTPRLLGRRLAGEAFWSLALVIWNLSLAGGIAALYVFDLGPNSPLTAMHWLFIGGLAGGALIVTLLFLVTAGPALRDAYVSVWFAGVALLSLAGLTGLAALLGLVDWWFDLDDLPVALASAFIERSLSSLWLLGVTFASLYYVVPRATGQPLASAGIGMLAFLTWLVVAPLVGLSTLLDPSIPYAISSLGNVGAMLLLVPVALTVINLVQTMRGRFTLVFGVGSAAFALVSLAFLLAATLLAAIGTLRSVDALVGGTDWELGAFLWIAYGAFALAAFAIAEHALPRMLRRAWGGGALSGATLWLAFGGTTIAGLALMGGGMAEGSLLSQAAAPDAIDQALVWYRGAAFLGFSLVALAGITFLVNLFLMYTSGEPADYAIPGAAAAAAGH